jgi:class 3 adenylate cyclase
MVGPRKRETMRLKGVVVRRLGRVDRALLFTFLPIWAFWFAFYLNNLIRGRVAVLPIYVSAPESPVNYPTLLGFWDVPWGGLQVGDRLLKVGQADLRGVWPVGFVARKYKETDASLHLPLVFLRAGLRNETVLSLRAVPFPWVWAVINVSFVGFAILLLLRKPNSRLIRATFLVMMLLSFRFIPFAAGAREAPLALTYVRAGFDFVSASIVFPLVLRLTYLFPEEAITVDARLPRWPWLFSMAGPIWYGWMFGVAPAPRAYAALSVSLAFFITYLGRGTYRFFHADPVARRQVKWVLFGVYLALVPTLGVELLVFVRPSLWPMFELVRICYVIIPLCVFIAIVRFNLFDIDRLISATAAYTIVSVAVIAGAITMLPRVSQVASSAVALNPAAGQLIVSLLLAAAVVSGSRYLSPEIERFFFAERYALERGVEHLLRELSACAGPQEVLTLVGRRLDSLLRPESCIVYGRSGETYAPLFFRGRAVTPTINVAAALVTALQSEAASVEVERWMRRRGIALASPDRAVLDSLGAAVLVPMRRGNIVAAFLCLGQKRSGDIYTATDLTLLSAVAENVSAELRRCDEAEIARQVGAMRDSLRRYVPEQIAAHVVSGHNLEARESHVSVLFVDLRGYTAYAEDKPPAEVFSTVNRYTEAVSRIVRAHGGTVVEFNGDGMMAVFGAPTPLAEKERAAVAAGREIVFSVHSLELGSAQREQLRLEVGVGIATGKAFVGNIHSVDRLIWSAIGDTSNLAARLQALTRELNAAIVIDTATRTSAGDAADDFERHDGMPIRGRRQTADIYALPLAASKPLIA